MAAQKQMLDQVDGTADSLMESMGEVQTTMAQLHSSVGVLIDSMAEILKSMAEMKSAVLQHTSPAPTNESQLTVEKDLPAAPEKQSIAVDKPVEEKQPRRIYVKKVKAKMPVFEGLKVNLWILQAERYFEFGDFTEAEKVRIVYMSVEGQALNWFVVSDRSRPFTDWEDVKSRLLDRFGHLESAMSRLLALKQVGSVREYLGQFEELATQLPAKVTPDFFFEGVFVNGLREEIKDMLPLFQPKGLDNIISMARRLENSRCFGRLMTPPLDDPSPADDRN
ncbi:uncharacterized protein LOC112086684 [Eutrema salsugineum]|uniref:uncharacterized protein LOC112086684 n=1 Tax=Eutrema salsugineum TaxID=72664 RepID=UPI000CED620A|nr:uncharacterized protein LOC112086684 [Eutrema salsugineum]